MTKFADGYIRLNEHKVIAAELHETKHGTEYSKTADGLYIFPLAYEVEEAVELEDGETNAPMPAFAMERLMQDIERDEDIFLFGGHRR